MAFPVRTVNYPLTLNGQINGKLDPAILLSTPGQAGGPTVRLVEPAARAWRALCAAALKAGHTLKASSPADSYRTYEQQVATFTDRFSLEPTGTGVERRWNGQTWYLEQGKALAAVPGTSNHGLGLAVDTGEERDGDSGTESMDAATLDWLLNHELVFGFSHEVQSEPWHIRYFAGDAIPAAVLAYEEQVEDMTPEQAQSLQRIESYLFYEVLGRRNPIQIVGDAVNHPPNRLDDGFDGLKAQLDDLTADVAEIKAKLDQLLTDGVQVPAEVTVGTASVAEIATATVDQFKGRL